MDSQFSNIQIEVICQTLNIDIFCSDMENRICTLNQGDNIYQIMI